MKIDFVRFEASDGVELQGWMNHEAGDTAAVHIHGMSGNGYENYFLDNLRKMYEQKGITFFTIDTRGRGIASDFKQGNGTKHGGSCFEIFDESIYDIQGAIDYLKGLGKTKFILQGHSLGGSKVVNYVVSKNNPEIIASVLLAPTDMTGWANTDSSHHKYLQKAKQLMAAGKNEELVGVKCWKDKTPISAQTYPTICEEGSSADIYSERKGGVILGKLQIPTIIAYGTEDIGILDVDGSVEKFVDRVSKIKNQNTAIQLIKDATHSYAEHEDELAASVGDFVSSLT